MPTTFKPYTVADLVADLLKVPQDLPVIICDAEESTALSAPSVEESTSWWDWDAPSSKINCEGPAVRFG